MPPNESQIVSAICDYLALKKYLFWRNNNIPVFDQGRGKWRAMPKHTMRGLPDIEMILAGQFVGLEVKRPKGVQSPFQKLFQQRCEMAGGRYHIVHSIDEVQKLGL